MSLYTRVPKASAFSFTYHLIFAFVSLFSSKVFCSSNKAILNENDNITFPNLNRTYKMIADNKADVFYNGSLTQTIVDDIKAAGYLMLTFDPIHI